MPLTVLLIDTEENRARALEEKLSESGFARVIRAEGPDLAAAVERAKPDLVIIDMNAAHIQPVGDVAASLVYNARGSDVDTLIVAGRIVIQNKQVLRLDEAALLNECRDRAKHLEPPSRLGLPSREGGATDER